MLQSNIISIIPIWQNNQFICFNFLCHLIFHLIQLTFNPQKQFFYEYIKHTKNRTNQKQWININFPAFSFASSGRDFDPRTRAFSDEELKPQPMIKKSRKQFVPDELKDDKYWARRRKNNIAAKRSRDARRQKENQIAMRARYLEKEVNWL